MTWKGEEEDVVYSSLVRAFLILCQTIPLDPGMSKALDDFNYSIIPRLLPENTIRIRHLEEPKSEQILNNVEFNSITRLLRLPTHLRSFNHSSRKDLSAKCFYSIWV